jgi:hypothetical protein
MPETNTIFPLDFQAFLQPCFVQRNWTAFLDRAEQIKAKRSLKEGQYKLPGSDRHAMLCKLL